MSFRKAQAAKIGGKFLSYGESGSGKSTFQLTFPRVACIDSETGVAHYEGKDITLNNGRTYNNLILVDNTSDLDELEEDLDAFLDGEYDGQIDTLSIDSESKFYATMQIGATEVEERRARKKGGDVDDAGISVKQWGRIKIINMKLQQAKIDLSSKGTHVVSVAQEVEIKDDDGKKVIGYKPDMHKSVKFDYDTILRHYTKKDKEGNVTFWAEVIKDRTNVTKVGQQIENPSFDIWKDYYDAMNGLGTNKTSYKNDLKTSTESMVDEADKADALAEEWKEMMKQLKNDNNLEAIKKINASGYLAIVVTNQPVIARGEVSFDELEKIHNKMETLLGKEGAYLDAIYYCPHHPHKGYEGERPELKIDCGCREPKPGMLLKAAKDFNIDLSQSWMIGDGENDVKAGQNAGCKTALIGGGEYGQIVTVASLKSFVERYLSKEEDN